MKKKSQKCFSKNDVIFHYFHQTKVLRDDINQALLSLYGGPRKHYAHRPLEREKTQYYSMLAEGPGVAREFFFILKTKKI